MIVGRKGAMDPQPGHAEEGEQVGVGFLIVDATGGDV